MPAQEEGRGQDLFYGHQKHNFNVIPSINLFCDEAILNKGGQAPQVGTLRISFPIEASLQTGSIILSSIITILCKISSSVSCLLVSGVGLEGL